MIQRKAVPDQRKRQLRLLVMRKHRQGLMLHLGKIIALNTVIMMAICGCLYGFSIIDDLNVAGGWDKRLFNSISIPLIASLSLGIGWLLLELGRIVRWPLLAQKPHLLHDVRWPMTP